MQKNPIKILLIENNADDAKLIDEFLKDIQDESFQSTWVDCYKKARRKLKKEKFDIILSELNLADCTGLDTIGKLQEITKLTPILVVTALDDASIGYEAIKMGAQDYLSKDKINSDILLRVIRNAIERNRLKILSQENEEKYFNLFNNSLNAFALHEIVTNKKGEPVDYIYLEVNEAFEQIVGLKAKEIIGKKVTEIIPGIEEEPFIGIYGRVALTGEPNHFEMFSTTLEKHFEITAFSPRKGQFAAIFMDTTERKKAESELRDHEQRLRTIIEHSNELFYIHNIEHELTYVSPQCKEILGYTPEEMMVNWTTLATENPINKEGIRITEKAIRTGKRQPPYLLELRTKDGQHRFVLVDESPIKDENGKVLGVSGALRDVTEKRRSEFTLKESEEKFRILAEQSPNAIFINQGGKIVYANKKSLEQLGYSEEELYSRDFDFLNLIAPESFDIVKSRFRQHTEGKEVEPYEYTIQTKDGHRIEAINSTKLIEYNGQPAILGVATDITERKKAEEELKANEDRFRSVAESANDALVIADSNGYITFCNNSMEKMFGYKNNEVINKSLTMLMPKAFHGSHERGLNDYLKTNRAEVVGKTTELAAVRKNGIEFPIELSLSSWQSGGETFFTGIIRDISERKQAEFKLRKRSHELGERIKEMTCLYGVHHLIDNPLWPLEQKLQKIVSILPPGWQYPQETCARIFYEGKEYVTDNFNQTKWKLAADIIIKGGKKGVVEVFYLEEKPEMKIGPFLREEEDLIKTIAKNIQEYIEHKHAIDELRNSEERLKILFESAPDAIYLNDLRGNFVDANKAAERLTGFEKEELIDKNMLESGLLSTSQVAKAAKLLTKNAIGKPTGPDEFTLNRKDGSKIIVEISTFPVKIQNRNLVLGIARDITERRRAEEAIRYSEEKYRTLFEESRDAIYMSTLDGKFIDINPAGVELFGYDSRDELKSVNIKDAIYGNPSHRKKFQNTLREKGAVSDYEISLKRKNGEEIIALVSATVVRDENGNIIGYRGIIRDITDQKNLERQLLQAQKMEAIGTLAGGIAHDFNNILSAILGYTELTKGLISENGNGIINSNLEQVYKAGLRAKDLTQQILTFSRQTDHEPQPLQLGFIIKEAIKLLRASLPATIEIRMDVAQDCGYVLADPAQVHQMVMNLCTNAFDAMREKGGILEVKLNSVDVNENQFIEGVNLAEGKYIQLIVSDTGMGIDEQTLKRIFDPFYTTKQAGAGTGLGLSVVHGAVKKHNGEITVQSEPGHGTTFTIYLPQINAKAEEKDKDQQEAFRGTENILYVDDEEPIVQAGTQILRELGYRVNGQTNSLRALELFRQMPDQFDMVITDLTMPNMVGTDLAQKILEVRPDIPIILITGYSENVTIEKAKQMGIIDLIMKPVLSVDLGKAIRRTLDQQKIGV